MSTGISYALGFADVRNVPVYIYGLTGSDGEVRYVGKSWKPRNRFATHRSWRGTQRMKAWMAELSSRGDAPRLVMLHVVPPGVDAGPYELFFVREYRKSGRLLNAPCSMESMSPRTTVTRRTDLRCRYCRSTGHFGNRCPRPSMAQAAE